MNVTTRALASLALLLLLAPDRLRAQDHSGHVLPAPAPARQLESIPPVEPIPPITELDRAAAFPELAEHMAHGEALHAFWLIDKLEAWDADPGTGQAWELQGWIGGDLQRVWLRSEGERIDGTTESGDLEVLYGRSIARWWDVVAGVRHDFKPGASQDFAAIGVVGLAPYKFEVEATAYIGQAGQTAARFEAEYETLLSNRLILQWQAEAELYAQDDPRRGIGSGLSTVEAGLRLRYEFTRQFAPYFGLAWERACGGTADFRRDEGEAIDDTRFVAGLRVWF
jgi:copper resistance protein B